MENIYPILEQLLLMAVLILLGFYLKRSGKINQAAEKGIAELTIDIAFPALIFTNIVRDFNLNLLKRYLLIPLSSFIITTASILMILLIARGLKYSNKESKEVAFVSSFSNNIFVGAPIAIAIFGAQGLIIAIFYDFGMHLVVWSLGVWLLNSSEKNRERNFLKNIFSAPIVALLFSIIVVMLRIDVPEIIINISENIANITVPLAMIFIGLKLAQSRVKKLFGNKKIYLVSVLRLLIIPSLVYLGSGLFSLPDLYRGVITILASMPVFATSPVIMQKFNHNGDLASEAIFATIVFMIFTLPLFIYITI
ncbi:MAG: AEC family transporter [Halanaerobium sp. MSAO_Bac5]|nr:MAG: AEC family transporter [Halanaerobium sp. MSAO_Bac5]